MGGRHGIKNINSRGIAWSVDDVHNRGIAGLVSESPIQIQSAEIINESFPHFGELFVSLGAEMGWQG